MLCFFHSAEIFRSKYNTIDETLVERWNSQILFPSSFQCYLQSRFITLCTVVYKWNFRFYNFFQKSQNLKFYSPLLFFWFHALLLDSFVLTEEWEINCFLAEYDNFALNLNFCKSVLAACHINLELFLKHWNIFKWILCLVRGSISVMRNELTYNCNLHTITC